jgi:hypothetical protein
VGIEKSMSKERVLLCRCSATWRFVRQLRKERSRGEVRSALLAFVRSGRGSVFLVESE